VARRSNGPRRAAAAHRRDFYAARRAFVADGCAYNRSIRRGSFADFVPLVDFLHVVGSRFQAARAVAVATARRPLYRRWLRSGWPGPAAAVVLHMGRAQEAAGRPPPGDDVAATAPRRGLAAALS
jgi:hypothetical protein